MYFNNYHKKHLFYWFGLLFIIGIIFSLNTIINPNFTNIKNQPAWSSISNNINSSQISHQTLGNFAAPIPTNTQGATQINNHVYSLARNNQGNFGIQVLNLNDPKKTTWLSGNLGRYLESTNDEMQYGFKLGPLGHANGLTGYQKKDGRVTLLIPRFWGGKIVQVEINKHHASITGFFNSTVDGQPVKTISSISNQGIRNGKMTVVARMDNRLVKAHIKLNDSHSSINFTSYAKLPTPNETDVLLQKITQNDPNLASKTSGYNIRQNDMVIGNHYYIVIDKIRPDKISNAGSLIVEFNYKASPNKPLKATGRYWSIPNTNQSRFEVESVMVDNSGKLLATVSNRLKTVNHLNGQSQQSYQSYVIQSNWQVAKPATSHPIAWSILIICSVGLLISFFKVIGLI